MLNINKILSLSLVTSLLLSSAAAALPKDTIVMGTKSFSTEALFGGVSGIQTALDTAGNSLFYNLDGQTNGYVGLFDGKPITQAQKEALKNILHTDKVGTNLTEVTYLNFDDLIPTVALTVKTAVAINATTIEVTFSNNAKKTYTVDKALVAGNNIINIKYEDKNYSITVSYVPPAISSVEKIEFVNYRNIKVTFNTLVDNASAINPNNYYLELINGNAKASGAVNTLQESNQFSEIETKYAGGAAAWWKKHILASNENGKTVVNIYLPEDARFTNLLDNESLIDAEKTLGVDMKTSKTFESTLKALLKETSVNVAVRNVKDLNGKFTIDTAVQSIKILDEVSPKLNEVKRVKADSEETLSKDTLIRNLGNFDLLRNLESTNQIGDKLKFVYSEPVFDAHDLIKSDIERVRDIRLYVDSDIVASLYDGNLDQFMTFQMDVNSTYEGSRTVTLDVEKAIKAHVNGSFDVGTDYMIRFVGVTDLAGNIEVSSEHSFNVKFHDATVVVPTIVKPEVKAIVQVADNTFRIEFNRAGVEGTLKIKNPDGEGVGELSVYFLPSAKSENKSFYSYVTVPARDNETNGAVPAGLAQDQVLAYDKQDKIYRDICIEDVKVVNDAVAKATLYGDSFFKKGMPLVNDIKAPVATMPEEIKYNTRGTVLRIPIKDLTPWINDENITPWVSPIAYDYNFVTERFGNDILENQKDARTYLPIKVSYVNANGAIHQAMISNYNMRPEAGLESDRNPGYPNSISFDASKNHLLLDLSNYKDLLDTTNKLIENKAYNIEIPKGYFTDSPKDTDLYSWYNWNNDTDFVFNGTGYDILHVDDSRDDDKYFWWYDWYNMYYFDSGLGFTSSEQTVDVHVEAKPIITPAPEYVPQTSKQLINYDEAFKSLKIEFTGTINIATLKDKNNYSFDGKTLASWDALLGTNTVIDYVVNKDSQGNNHQYAVFKIPSDSIQEFGDYSFSISGVKHPSGATMTPVETVVKLYDNYRPIVTNAVVTGDKQIKLTFNENIQYFVDPDVLVDSDSTARNFKLTIAGVTWTVDSAVIPLYSTNNREIILNLGNIIPATGDIKVEIVKDQNNNILVIDKSTGKNPIKEAVYTVTRT